MLKLPCLTSLDFQPILISKSSSGQNVLVMNGTWLVTNQKRRSIFTTHPGAVSSPSKASKICIKITLSLKNSIDALLSLRKTFSLVFTNQAQKKWKFGKFLQFSVVKCNVFLVKGWSKNSSYFQIGKLNDVKMHCLKTIFIVWFQTSGKGELYSVSSTTFLEVPKCKVISEI